MDALLSNWPVVAFLTGFALFAFTVLYLIVSTPQQDPNNHPGEDYNFIGHMRWYIAQESARRAQQAAQQQAFDVGKPQPPPPKSKRPTARQVMQEDLIRRFQFPVIALVVIFVAAALDKANPYVSFTPFAIILGIILTVAGFAYYSSEWFKTHQRNIENEARDKFAAEDAVWAKYEQDFATWQANKNRPPEPPPAPPPKPGQISEDVAAIIREFKNRP